MRVDKGFQISHSLLGRFFLAWGGIFFLLMRLLGRVHRIQDGAGLLQRQEIARQGSGVVCVLYLELPLLLESFLQGDGGLCLFQLFFLLL